MARIPTVGPNQVHTVQLDPKLRKILHHRAAAAARRESAPILAADREALEIPKQEYQAQAAADRGVSSTAANVLAQLLGSLDTSGLTGRYRQETAQGLKQQQAAALSSLPYLLAGAGEERAKGLTEARTQLAQDRGTMLSNAASGFNSLLASARSTGSQSLKEQDDRERTHRQEVASNERDREAEVKENHRDKSEQLYSDQSGVRNAYEVARTAYTHMLGHFGEETKNGGEIKPPQSVQDWRVFAEEVAKHADGADQEDALTAVEELRKQLKKLQHGGKLPQPGSEVEQE